MMIEVQWKKQRRSKDWEEGAELYWGHVGKIRLFCLMKRTAYRDRVTFDLDGVDKLSDFWPHDTTTHEGRGGIPYTRISSLDTDEPVKELLGFLLERWFSRLGLCEYPERFGQNYVVFHTTDNETNTHLFDTLDKAIEFVREPDTYDQRRIMHPNGDFHVWK